MTPEAAFGLPEGVDPTLTPLRYGWHQSPPDDRNVETLVPNVPVKPEVDSTQWLPSAYNQLNLGSCTGNAFCRAMRNYFIVGGVDVGDFSRLDAYWGERTMEGTVSQDSGAIGHDAFKWARRHGLVLETVWPYVLNTFATPPADLESADHYHIKAYSHPARDIEVFKKLLSNQQLICFGFSVPASFERVNSSGIFAPAPGEQLIGGHEVVIGGYVRINGIEYVQVWNSWGPGWGRNGLFYTSWDFILGKLTADFRCIDPVF